MWTSSWPSGNRRCRRHASHANKACVGSGVEGSKQENGQRLGLSAVPDSPEERNNHLDRSCMEQEASPSHRQAVSRSGQRRHAEQVFRIAPTTARDEVFRGKGRTDFVVVSIHAKADGGRKNEDQRHEEAKSLILQLATFRKHFADEDVILIGVSIWAMLPNHRRKSTWRLDWWT